MKTRASLYVQGKALVDEYIDAGKTAEWEKTIEVRIPSGGTQDETTFTLVQRKLKLVVKTNPVPPAPPPKILEPPAQTVSVLVPSMDQVVTSLSKNNEWSAEFNRRWEATNGHLANVATNISSFFQAQVKLVEELTAELHWERIRNQNLEAENDRLRSLGNGKILPVRTIRPKLFLPREKSEDSVPF